MPCIEFYATQNDFINIIDYLNKDDEIAYIVYDGMGQHKSRWKAVRQISQFNDFDICLWHIPSGDLPLIGENGEEIGIIANPWNGWEELRTAGNPLIPWFSDYAGNIFIKNSTQEDRFLKISAFSWVGNYWAPVGKAASKQTELWWKKLRKHIAKSTIKIGRTDAMKPEIFCFKEAKIMIENGVSRSMYFDPSVSSN